MIPLLKIIVDSACDLPQHIIEKLNIEVLPFRIYIDKMEFKDGIDISTEDVYKAMKEGKFPRTAQVSPHTFKNTFEKYARKGINCIYIAFSSKLSGAFQTGKMIANRVKEEFPDFNIDVIDSKCGSTAIGIAVQKASEMIKNGKNKKDIINTIKFYTQHLEHIFTLDSLKYLQHGGRISKTKALIGDILNIKPILHVKNGEIFLLKKCRGKKKTIDTILDIMVKKGKYIKNQTIGISHANDEKLALKIKEKIEDKFGYSKFIINFIGSVLGVHLGIGGVGVFFLNEYPTNSSK